LFDSINVIIFLKFKMVKECKALEIYDDLAILGVQAQSYF